VSAFLVDDASLDVIATALAYPEHVDVSGGDPVKLKVQLADMNKSALVARYGGDQGLEEEPEPWHYRRQTLGQTLKTVRCYLYQCHEGNVLECELYKRVERLRDALTEALLSRVPEYKDAEWR
jgi:hypothetical protein